ncbi:MAG: hypothetical protein GX250_00605 [Clostridiales bacterium]|jgi:uncharacterized membrane protein SpoIIM required for sporulation|nr:hypothetical protein [Clostridiales bacterium]
MNIRIIRNLLSADKLDTIGFALCASLFLVGALSGAVSANYISDYSGTLLKNYFLSAESGVFVSGGIVKALFDSFLYPAIAVFLGFAAFGFILLPLLSGLKGFVLTFVAASIIKVLGSTGWLVSLSLFGLTSLLSFPCLLILSVQAFTASYTLTGALLRRRAVFRGIYGKVYFFRCLLCVAVLIITAFIDAYLVPILAALAAG